MIAVVFSQPSTHRTIQLKGSDARIVRATRADRGIAQQHLHAWVQDLHLIGYATEFARAVRGEAPAPRGGRVHARIRVPADARARLPGQRLQQ